MYPKEQSILKSWFTPMVYNMLKDCQAVVAGGAITSLFTNKEVNDVDIYFKTKQGWTKFLVQMMGLVNLSDIGEYEIRVWHHTKRSILVKHEVNDHYDKVETNIQLIGMDVFPTVNDIFKSFDFTINMGAYDFEKEEFVLGYNFLKHNAQRILSFNEKTTFPLMSALRVQKYQERGYTISKAQMFRILLAVNLKKFNSWEDFKNELGGLYGLDPDEVVDESKEFSIEEGMTQLEQVFISNKYKNLKSITDSVEIEKEFSHMSCDGFTEWLENNAGDFGIYYVSESMKEALAPILGVKYEDFI